ncbi:MAG: SGNH/GDSL hydrolase family protein [Acetatifactor sp.]|nr:SGNH/GDSL hydrolase family protein [Acetatifactor sp.]
MKKHDRNAENISNNSELNHIPTIEILDLEHDDISTDPTSEEAFEDGTSAQSGKTPQKLPRFLNLHTLVLLVVVVFVVCIFMKFRNWGVFIDQNDIISDEDVEYYDVLDQIMPLMTDLGEPVQTGPAETILLFGNSPFADDRDSKDNLANIIAEKTGATVYNCAIGDSYLAAQHYAFDANTDPMDAYTFYWLVTYALSGVNEGYYTSAALALGEDTPYDAQEVLATLKSIDMADIDVVAIMYDATDYLMGHQMYSDENFTDIEQFTGNLEAGIEAIQYYCPNTRIIILSPTYAYAVTEDGEYVSSSIYTYGQAGLPTYSVMQLRTASVRCVSYIDNLYGTITEDNADQYLIDNLHLNVAGRNLVADRFVEALNMYNRVWEE